MQIRWNIFYVIACSFLSALLLYACTKDKTPRPVEPCDPQKVYFQRDIMPIMNSNCAKSGCHDAISNVEGYNFSTYEGVMEAVRPGRPENSELFEKITEDDKDDRMPPPPNAPLSTEQKNLISRWISEGAGNLVCSQDSTSCNTTSVTFSSDISAILNTNCIGCHNNTTMNAGVNLTTYSGAYDVAVSGKLYNAVAHTGAATPMPPNQKLAPCDIQKIKAWVDAGSPDN